MAILETLIFKDWSGKTREVRFLSNAVELSAQYFEITLITGQNGSNKSTLLRELVAALTIPTNISSIQLRQDSGVPTHVICKSGSVADRFPSKEATGGWNSEFDVPNYSYLADVTQPP